MGLGNVAIKKGFFDKNPYSQKASDSDSEKDVKVVETPSDREETPDSKDDSRSPEKRDESEAPKPDSKKRRTKKRFGNSKKRDEEAVTREASRRDDKPTIAKQTRDARQVKTIKTRKDETEKRVEQAREASSDLQTRDDEQTEIESDPSSQNASQIVQPKEIIKRGHISLNVKGERANSAVSYNSRNEEDKAFLSARDKQSKLSESYLQTSENELRRELFQFEEIFGEKPSQQRLYSNLELDLNGETKTVKKWLEFLSSLLESNKNIKERAKNLSTARFLLYAVKQNKLRIEQMRNSYTISNEDRRLAKAGVQKINDSEIPNISRKYTSLLGLSPQLRRRHNLAVEEYRTLTENGTKSLSSVFKAYEFLGMHKKSDGSYTVRERTSDNVTEMYYRCKPRWYRSRVYGRRGRWRKRVYINVRISKEWRVGF